MNSYINSDKNKTILINNYSTGIYCAIILLFIIFRILIYFETEYFVIWFDSAQFAATSFASVWSNLFWSDGIPPLYPFFLKHFTTLSSNPIPIENSFLSLFSYNPTIIKGIELLDNYPYLLVKNNFDIISASLFQFLFSTLSCVIFALSFSSIFKNIYIKLVSTTFILMLGMESSITLWDKHILTESISISLLFITISFLIHIKYVAKNIIFLVLFLLILISLSFIKITNNYLIVLLIPLVVFHFIKGNYNYKINYALLFSTLLSLFIFNQYMLFNGDRSNVPMKDLISSRISTQGYADIYYYFRNSGMPELPKDTIGKLWTAPFEDYPELNDWWINKSSKTYQTYLITHPGYFFFRPFQYTNEFNKPVYNYLTPDLHFHEQVAPTKLKIIFTDTFLWISFSVLSLLLLSIFIKNKTIDIDNTLLPIFLLISGTALYLIIWHADLGELDRHLIQCAIMLRIAILMLLMIFASFLVKKDH